MKGTEITPAQLKALFADRDVAVFAGAGLSVDAPSFCPDWNEFRSMILVALLRSTAGDGLVETSHQSAFYERLVGGFRVDPTRQFKPEVFMELLRDQIGDHVFKVLSILKGGSYNDNHLFLARAAKAGHLNVIVTTNFDQYIEEALTDVGVAHKVYSHPSDFVHLSTTGDWLGDGVSVVKLHGSLERPDTVRVTLMQAARPLERAKADVLQTILRRSHVLFYGYSGNDDDIYPILHDSHEISLGIIWCLWESSSLSPSIERLLSMYGSRARVLNQKKEPLFSRLFSALEYDHRRPSPWQQSGSADEMKTSKQLADQGTLDTWAKAVRPAARMHVLATSCRSLSDFELAKRAFWKELDLLQKDQDGTAYARTTRALGEVLEMEQDWNSAFDCYASSMVLTQEVGDQLGYADSCAKMSKLQSYLGNRDKALELVENSIRVYESLDLRGRLAEALNVMAEVLMYQERVNDAQEKWIRALQICEEDGDLVNASATSSNLALAFRFQGNFDRARILLEKSLMLDSRHGDSLGVAFTYGNLAFLDEDTGQLQKAMEEVDQAIEILKTILAAVSHFDRAGGGVAFAAALDKHIKARQRIERKLKAGV